MEKENPELKNLYQEMFNHLFCIGINEYDLLN